MRSFIWIAFVMIVIFIGFPALAQGVPVPAPVMDPPWWMIVLALVSPVASFLATMVSSKSRFGKLVDLFAMAWGKARSDPSRQ